MSLASLSRQEIRAAIPVGPQQMPVHAQDDAPRDGTGRPDGFQMLTRYIPTEAITLYVAAMAARADVASALSWTDAAAAHLLYWSFGLVTVLILWVMLIVRRKQGDATRAPAWWTFGAALAAYLVWGLSVPGHPAAEALGGLPALGALILSTLLSVAEPAVPQRPDAN